MSLRTNMWIWNSILGCLKVTPSHDVNDYVLEKNTTCLPSIFSIPMALNSTNTVPCMPEWPLWSSQTDRKRPGRGWLMEKIEAYTNKVGYSERTDVPIEPKLSMQWFLKMKGTGKTCVWITWKNDTIKFHPEKYKNTYRYWMENLKDWCISRQLWWGHRIPVYYAWPL